MKPCPAAQGEPVFVSTDEMCFSHLIFPKIVGLDNQLELVKVVPDWQVTA